MNINLNNISCCRCVRMYVYECACWFLFIFSLLPWSLYRWPLVCSYKLPLLELGALLAVVISYHIFENVCLFA